MTIRTCAGVLAVAVAACAGPPELGDTESLDQQRLVIYVRDANPGGAPGSDATGDGSLAAPYRTVRRALADGPLDVLNTRYVVDCTDAGVEDVGPDGLFVPPIRASGGLTSMPSPLPHPIYDFEGVLTIRALPHREHTIAAGEPVVQRHQPDTGLLQVQVPGRTWAVDQWKGMLVSGAGRGEYGVIAGNSADELLITWSAYEAVFTPPIAIESPSCGLRYGGTSPSKSALVVRGMTGSLVLAGLRLAVAPATGVALAYTGPVIPRFEGLDLDGATGGGTYLGSHVRGSGLLPPWPSKLAGRTLRRIGSTFVFNNSFLEDVQFFHGGAAAVDGAIQIGSTVLDRCAHVGENIAEEGYSGDWEIQGSWLRGTRGDGFRAPAAQRSYVYHTRIDGAVGDAVVADGPGYAELMDVSGSGSAGFGVRAVNGGQVRLIDRNTEVTGAAGELRVGARAPRRWIDFRTLPPAYSEADFAPDTGDGSRLWQLDACCGLWTVWGAGASYDVTFPHGVAVTPDGGVVAVGMTASPTLTFAGGPGLPALDGWDGFVVARNPDGTARWARRFGDAATAVAATADGGAVIVGRYGGPVSVGGAPLPAMGWLDGFATRVDAGGRHLWSVGLGGPTDDTAAAVAIDPAGDVVVVVNTDWSPWNSAGTVALYKLAGATGAELWRKPLIGTGAAGFDVATGADGDVYLAGAMGNTSGGSLDFGGGVLTSGWCRRGFVARLRGSDGGFRWAQAIDDSLHSDLNAVEVRGDAVFVAGASRGWARIGGGPPVAVGGEYDFFVARLDAATGAHRWSHAHGGPGYEIANDLALAHDGTLVVVGSVGSPGVSFGGGPVAFGAPYDLVVARYDQATGAHRASLSRGGNGGDDVATGVAVDPRTGNVILAGYASSNFDLGDGFAGDPLGSYGAFVADFGRP